MKGGNWVPLSKAFVTYLPKTNRPYTELEAAFSLQVKYDNDETVTTAGLSALWNWSRKRVVNFIKVLKIAIEYEKDTKILQNQRGQIALQIRNRSGTDKEQIRFIDSKELPSKENRSGTDKEQIRNRSGSTSNDPNPNPELKPSREKKFKPPSVHEVSDYMAEINYKGDAQNFVDSNTAKGWLVGKNKTPAKDWKAMVRTWHNNENKKTAGQQLLFVPPIISEAHRKAFEKMNA